MHWVHVSPTLGGVCMQTREEKLRTTWLRCFNYPLKTFAVAPAVGSAHGGLPRGGLMSQRQHRWTTRHPDSAARLDLQGVLCSVYDVAKRPVLQLRLLSAALAARLSTCSAPQYADCKVSCCLQPLDARSSSLTQQIQRSGELPRVDVRNDCANWFRFDGRGMLHSARCHTSECRHVLGSLLADLATAVNAT